jgi:DNA-binding transcriptional LysR family regulator
VHQLAPLLPAFRARFPKVSIELSAPGPVSSIDENFDISILMTQRRPDGEFIARLLAKTDWIVCAAASYLNERGRPTHPSDLMRHRVMAPSTVREVSFRADASHPAHERKDAVVADETVTLSSVRAALSTSHIDTLFAAARAGLGIAGLPSFVVNGALRDGSLERVLPHWRLLTASIYLAMPTRQYVPARTRALWDFLLESLGGQERDPWLNA